MPSSTLESAKTNEMSFRARITALVGFFAVVGALAIVGSGESHLRRTGRERRGLFVPGLMKNAARGDWKLGGIGEDCGVVCGTASCDESRSSPMLLVNSRAKIDYVAGLFDLTCDSYNEMESTRPPFFDPERNRCHYHEEDAEQLSCGRSSTTGQLFCCCGANCPVEDVSTEGAP